MSHRSSINQTLCKGAALLLLCFAVAATSLAAGRTSKHVILITIDGMRAEMVTDSTMPSPNLKRMKRDGLFVRRIKGITPTATYPSHITIVTGVKPARHNIYYNAQFTGNQATVPYWYADSIKATTIWEAVDRAGLTTASLFWPVSTGSEHIRYNVPEFWSTQRVANQLEYIKPYCTPAGILDELEREATGKLNHENFMAGSMMRDARTAAVDLSPFRQPGIDALAAFDEIVDIAVPFRPAPVGDGVACRRLARTGKFEQFASDIAP